MPKRTSTETSVVRPRSRHTEPRKETETPAAAVVAGEAARDWVMIRVPKVSIAKPMSESAVTAAGTEPMPAPAAVVAEAEASAPMRDASPKKHFRIDAAHIATPAPHVAAEAWSQRQANWVDSVGGWKTLTAVGLVAAVLIGALAARSTSKLAKTDSAEDAVTSSDRTDRLSERERRLARRRAIEARRQGVADSELSNDPDEFEADEEAIDSQPLNTATTASWQFNAASNTPASLRGRNGRATAVNLNVERRDRSAHRQSIGGTGPAFPSTITPAPEDQSQYSAGNRPEMTSAGPRFRMAANESLTPIPTHNPSPGAVQLRGLIDHAPLH